MAAREGKGGFGFFFVNTSADNAEAVSTSRKEIRSWVTSVQHSRKSNSSTRKTRDNEEPGPVRDDAATPPSTASGSSSSTASWSASPSASSCKRKAAPPSDPRLAKHESHTDDDLEIERPTKYIKRSVSRDNTASIRYGSAAARATALAACVLGIDTSSILLSNSLDDPTDPLRCYSARLGIPASTLWTHYLWQEREHGRLFKAQHRQFGNTMAPKYLHPKILSDPAMLSTTVLFSACHLRYAQALTVVSSELLQIRSLAYGYVQTAINSEAQLEDSTFLAIIKLALWEVVFGSLSAFKVHMLGINQMVRLRGGLRTIGPDGYVGYILRWFDCNFTAVTSIPSFLEHEASLVGMESIETDVEAFLLGVDFFKYPLPGERGYVSSSSSARYAFQQLAKRWRTLTGFGDGGWGR